jgi:hypothetical protein
LFETRFRTASADQLAMQLGIASMKLTRRLALGVAAFAVVLSCFAITDAAAATVVVPVPRFHATTSVIRVGGYRRLLLRSLEIWNIEGEQLRVSCGRCVRIPGRIRLRRPTPGIRFYRDVNWVLAPEHLIQVELIRPGATGRYLSLGASLHPRSLVFAASGCLASLSRRIACPARTRVPKRGSTVPQHQPSPGSSTAEYQLTATMAGSGSGTITGDGISCPGKCTAMLPAGTSVSLAVSPTGGAEFDGWSGDCSGLGTCQVVLDSDQRVTATFTAQVTQYSCPGTANAFGHYVPAGHWWANSFTAQGSTIAGGFLLMGANQDGNNHQATVGVYTGGPSPLTGELGSVTVNVVGYGGVNFTFGQPIQVVPGESLWIGATGIGDFTAYDQNNGGSDGCFIGNLEGF